MAKVPPPTAEEIESLRLKWLAEHEPKIEPYLEPGERLHAIGWWSLGGVKHPPRRYLPRDDKITVALGWVDAVGNFLDDAPLAGCMGLIGFLGRFPPDCKGGWQSQAGRLVIAVSAAAKVNGKPRYLYLAITDRRVLLAVPPRDASPRRPEPAQLLGAYGPGEVGLRTVARRGTSPREIVLGFPDSSYVCLTSHEWAGGPVFAQFLAPIVG